jgi:RNA polymerase sigma factor (TIGR02999 family)
MGGNLAPVSEVTRILDALQKGDAQAAEELFPLIYQELRRLAAAKMLSEAAGHTLQPTALVHEAWLRLGGDRQPKWENRGHFFGAAAEAMRRILIERARRRSRLKHGANAERVDAAEIELPTLLPDDQLLHLDEALDQLQSQDPEKARIVMLKFFAGLTNDEVAQSLGVTERTVERHWAFAKVWLFQAMRKEG